MALFYSWQSWTNGKENRSFIEDALAKASKVAFSENEEIVDAQRIDQDARGVSGSLDIHTTIFEKIDTCDAFIADVTYVAQDSKGRLVPNPNVMVELGYAARTLGWNRIILVQNTAMGKPDYLPFDIRQKNVVTYEWKPGEARPNGEDRKLTAALIERLKSLEPSIIEARRQVTVNMAHVALEYLQDGKEIALGRLLDKHALNLRKATENSDLVDATKQPTPDLLRDRLAWADSESDDLVSIFAQCIRWTNANTVSPFVSAIKVATVMSDGPGNSRYLKWQNFKWYPVLKLVYAGLISGVAADNYAFFAQMTKETMPPKDSYHEPHRYVLDLDAPSVFSDGLYFHLAEDMSRNWPGYSVHMQQVMWPYFSNSIPSEAEFIRVFDQVEYLWAMASVCAQIETRHEVGWAPIGRFRHRDSGAIFERIDADVARQQGNWPPIKQNVFESLEHFSAARGELNKILSRTL